MNIIIKIANYSGGSLKEYEGETSNLPTVGKNFYMTIKDKNFYQTSRVRQVGPGFFMTENTTYIFTVL